ncbi:MAG: RagB/SusD family nutrient uptake outer membrane protein [Paludibacter sp.]
MKNKTAILIALVSMLIITSCNDLITDNPESKLSQVGFYNSPLSIQYGVMGCYSGMQLVIVDEWKFTENRTDNSCVANSGTGTSKRVDYCDIRFFRTPPSQPLLLGFWRNYFTNIMNVNAVLPAVAKGQTIIPSETLRAQYEGELLFIRAYHYFSLINLWGDMFKVTSILDKDQAKTLKRLPVDSIYAELIMPDLKIAAAQLPSTYSSNNIGRVTKWAAKGMLAKAYITRHSTNDLDSALVLLNDIINNSPHGLLTTDALVVGKLLKPYASIFDITQEMNKEVIFAIRFKGGTSGIGSPFWSTFAPDGSGSLFLTVGTPGGDNNATGDLLNVLRGDTIGTNLPNIRYHSSIIWYGKKSSSMIGAPNKWVDLTIQQVNQGENDWIVLRFADILLLRAEVLAQGATPDGARTDVNAIRARAGVNQYTSAFTSNTDALDKVYLERRLEFAFENIRWFDLLRMNKSYGIPEKAITILKYEMTDANSLDFYNLYSKYKPIVPPSPEYFTTSKLLLPIPQEEIDTYNSGNSLTLTQNDGY